MATALRNLTKMGTDVKQIARLLQKKAPPGHMLAYISPEEAEVLKNRGGSGRITEAGIPSFELDENLALQGPGPSVTDTTPSSFSYGGDKYATVGGGDTFSAEPAFTPTFAQSEPSYAGGGFGAKFSPDYSSFATSTGGETLKPPGGAVGGIGMQPLSTDLAPSMQTPTGQSAYDIASKTATGLAAPIEEKVPAGKGLSGDTLARLGIAGVGTLLGAKSARDAAAQGQAAKQALQAQAAPYQQKGQELLAATQRGELTPANQQILQAQQAQAAQNVATRGGVGGMQAQNQINALSQQLLQSQLNLGLQLQSVGDKITQGAIQAGVQADQYVNNLTSSYAMNIARTLVGGTPGEPTPTVLRG